MNDIVISGGTLIDGTGRPGARADVGIRDAIVSQVGDPGSVEGGRRIDADGLMVAPGLIDPHAHLDAMLLADPQFEAGLRQGVTTVVLGSDGCGYAPASEATLAFMRTSIAGFSGNPDSIGWDWRSLPDYMARFDGGRVAPNAAFLLPYGCLRADAVGLDDRPATAEERASIAEAAREGMATGALGFSWGFHYPPNTYATLDDLVDVARAVGAGAVFSTHMRDYEHAIDASLDEAFAVGRAAGVRVHISHLNMHHDQGIPPIEAALADGVDVSFDTYPYLAGSTVLTRHLPDWALAGGIDATLERLTDPAVRERLRPWLEAPERRWGSVLLGSIGSEDYRELQGQAPLEAAAALDRSITDLVCDLLVASRLEVGVIGFRHHRQNEEDIRRLLVHPRQVVASDGIYVGTNPHPRAFGTFARILGQYVRDEGLLPLEEAIRKMTSATARIFGLAAADPPRGTIRVGAAADVVVFDPATIADRASYESGRETAVGVEAVIVNGVPAVLRGDLTGILPGRVVRPARVRVSSR